MEIRKIVSSERWGKVWQGRSVGRGRLRASQAFRSPWNVDDVEYLPGMMYVLLSSLSYMCISWRPGRSVHMLSAMACSRLQQLTNRQSRQGRQAGRVRRRWRRRIMQSQCPKSSSSRSPHQLRSMDSQDFSYTHIQAHQIWGAHERVSSSQADICIDALYVRVIKLS